MVETVDTITNSLPWHIRQWIAETLADGYSREMVSRKLIGLGYDPGPIRGEICDIVASPGFAAATRAAKRRDKLASLLDVLAEQFRRTSAGRQVAVMEKPDAAKFFERYYFANQPVVVKGLMADWPALDTWSPQWLAEKYGECEVEVTSDRDADPRFEDNFVKHRQTMKLAVFIDRISERAGNDCYIVSKNRTLDVAPMAGLLEDIRIPEGFLTDGDRAPSLWFGPAGTITPLHHDSTNIFFGQVLGSKRIRLAPPFEIGNLYNDRACFSAIDLDAIDAGRYPLVREACVLDVTVDPGDFLLLPVGWWHMVRSLSTSISLSFQNFAVEGPLAVWRHDRPRKRTAK